MTAPAELDELHRLIGSVRQCVTSLKTKCGDTPAMRRLVNDADRLLNDVERLDIDAAELDLGRAGAYQHPGEKIPVPDTQYDTDFWRDVDDEGVGGQR
ncbi:hypothetical protein [Mycobacterium sp.]|uniref:hypothetical protein n=1 Tax=Mycobacterium sp. TaxID=1785 RepID=UPI002D31A18E|nr:hypothetical protein [Mycobacterium sp.]HZA09281.1 hypothetical protein [Mycobacterium sp.]